MKFKKYFEKYLKYLIYFVLFLTILSIFLERNISISDIARINIIYDKRDKIEIYPENYISKEESFYCSEYVNKKNICTVLNIKIDENKTWTDVNFHVKKPKDAIIMVNLLGKYENEPTIRYKDFRVNAMNIFDEIKNLSHKNVYLYPFTYKQDSGYFSVKIAQAILVWIILLKILFGLCCVFVIYYLIFFPKKFLKYLSYLFIFTFISLLIIVFFTGVMYSPDLPLESIYVAAWTLCSKEKIMEHILYIVLGIFCVVPVFILTIRHKKVCLPILFLLGSIYILSKTPVFYIQNENSIYKTKYLIPQITEPIKKKNILYISLESFDEGMTENPDIFGEHLIPNLKELQKQGLSFKNYNQVIGTLPTVPSFQSTMCGIPFKEFSVEEYFLNSKAIENREIKKAVCLPDILNKFGYENYIVIGFNPDAEGLVYLINNHNFKEENIFDRNKFSRDNFIKRWYYTPDSKLYNKAKEIMSNSKKPFFVSIITANTHGPKKGLVENGCEKKYDDMRDAYLCLDKITADFIKWIQKQPFYKDTVIVLAGDHRLWSSIFDYLNVDSKKLKQYDYNSSLVYNLFLNVDKKFDGKVINKNYSQFDFAPTILEAAGFKLSEPKFGLGVSLLSDRQTIVEEIGDKNFEKELKQGIYNYNTLFIK